MSFHAAGLKRRLEALDSSQEAIHTLSAYVRMHGRHFRQICDVWRDAFGEAPPDRRLALWYLMNDVLQRASAGKSGSMDMADTAQPVLEAAVATIRDDASSAGVRPKFERVLGIWRDRGTVPGGAAARLLSVARGDTQAQAIPASPVAKKGGGSGGGGGDDDDDDDDDDETWNTDDAGADAALDAEFSAELEDRGEEEGDGAPGLRRRSSGGAGGWSLGAQGSPLLTLLAAYRGGGGEVAEDDVAGKEAALAAVSLADAPDSVPELVTSTIDQGERQGAARAQLTAARRSGSSAVAQARSVLVVRGGAVGDWMVSRGAGGQMTAARADEEDEEEKEGEEKEEGEEEGAAPKAKRARPTDAADEAADDGAADEKNQPGGGDEEGEGGEEAGRVKEDQAAEAAAEAEEAEEAEEEAEAEGVTVCEAPPPGARAVDVDTILSALGKLRDALALSARAESDAASAFEAAAATLEAGAERDSRNVQGAAAAVAGAARAYAATKAEVERLGDAPAQDPDAIGGRPYAAHGPDAGTQAPHQHQGGGYGAPPGGYGAPPGGYGGGPGGYGGGPGGYGAGPGGYGAPGGTAGGYGGGHRGPMPHGGMAPRPLLGGPPPPAGQRSLLGGPPPQRPAGSGSLLGGPPPPAPPAQGGRMVPPVHPSRAGKVPPATGRSHAW